MEDSKKSKVLDVAMELFRKKGYASASMQDIAEACGMAKASIYKLFESKEALFTEAFVSCHRTLLEKAAELDRSSRLLGLSPEEKLRRRIELQLQYSVENHLFMIDFKDLPIKENDDFRFAWQKKKDAMLTWYKEMMLEVFGERIAPYCWDVVAIYRGIFNIYLNFVIQKAVSTPLSELAVFIVDRMNAIVQDLIRQSPRPIITDTVAYINALNPGDEAARQETSLELLQKMEQGIPSLGLPETARQEIAEIVGLLRAEIAKDEPRDALVRVLVSYLEAVPELRQGLRQLLWLYSNSPM